MRILVTIVDAGGKVQRQPAFAKAEVTIGRAPSNDVVLPDAGASGSHAKVVATGGELTLIDLDSTNGTYVNEDRITAPHVLTGRDNVQIGDYTLCFRYEGDEPEDYDQTGVHAKPEDAPVPPPSSGRDWPEPPPMVDELDGFSGGSRTSAPAPSSPAVPKPPASSPSRPSRSNGRDNTGSAMFPRLAADAAPEPRAHVPTRAKKDAASVPPKPVRRVGFEFSPAPANVLLDRVFAAVLEQVADEARGSKPGAKATASKLLDEALRAAARVGSLPRLDRLKELMVSEMVGSGPVPELLEGDPDEVLLLGTRRVRINRGGHVSEGPGAFTCAAAVANWVAQVCDAPFDAQHPRARGAFGPYAVHAVHDSAAEGSAVISLRRRESRADASLERLVQAGVLSNGMAALLNACVVSRLNVLLCAGPGASVLPLMAGLLSCAPAIELQAVVVNHGADVAAFREGTVVIARDAGSAPTLEDALALAPDRLGVDELRWGDAPSAAGIVSRTVSQILGVRAASSGTGLAHLEAMLSATLPAEAARQQLASFIDLVVSEQLFSDGVTRVTQVSEPVFDDSGRLTSRDVFTLVPGSRNWQFSGVTPRCYEDMTRRGFPLDPSIFS
jgi:pilus assembly protein CpaF